ncbi:MAG: hypothetical protein JXR37_26060 [Kiritimatiellae bacterium]|nr:hypothetical protein [Kiritimatiellia bacterium]
MNKPAIETDEPTHDSGNTISRRRWWQVSGKFLASFVRENGENEDYEDFDKCQEGLLLLIILDFRALSGTGRFAFATWGSR